MFERFTASARRVVVLAHGEARTLKQNHVGPQHHLLLGVLMIENATAAAVFAALGVEPEAVRRAVLAKHGCGEDEPSGHIRFSDDGKKVFEHSLRESLALHTPTSAPNTSRSGCSTTPTPARCSTHSACTATPCGMQS
jgi:ATP-dependent Clp protease ATP-binding subunit ClpA